MTVTDPFTVVATSLKTIIDAEFAPEGYTAIFDNLHESLGRKRVDIGIAPVEEVVMASNGLVNEVWVEIRFLHLWKQEITPDTVMNPTPITIFAERLRRAVQASNARAITTGQVWFYDVRRTSYPNDPTGNKTRFYMTIRAMGNNSALVETTG